MPYFPLKSDPSPYRCEGCKRWFLPSNMSCCVAHGPGSCCHEYETEVEIKPRSERNPVVVREIPQQTWPDGVVSVTRPTIGPPIVIRLDPVCTCGQASNLPCRVHGLVFVYNESAKITASRFKGLVV
jgi:hypothetical protein